VTGDAAVLVSPSDAEELTVALRRLHDSPALRADLADRALRRVGERFAWPAVAQATADEYRNAIAREAGRRHPGANGLAGPEDLERSEGRGYSC
jgi:glycosyltransferase involved in cell wall biosynthesis